MYATNARSRVPGRVERAVGLDNTVPW